MKFTDQNSKPLEIEDRTNLTLVIKISHKISIIKWGIQLNPKDEIFVKCYGFLSLGKVLAKSWIINTAKNFLIVLKRFAAHSLKVTSEKAI